ncbi:MAG: PEP/pyruvate-binding domain-containing protein, partial [Spirochaetota bacterium]
MLESTGLPELDKILDNLKLGDNIVWRVDETDDYRPFVEALAHYAIAHGKKLVYFRFANHKPLLSPQPGLIIRETHPEAGFENFITETHWKIKKMGAGGFFIFDSISDLSQFCYSDRMIGNFFKLTCPYLRKLKTVAYFCMYRYFHSYHAATPIHETTRLLLDIYRHKEKLYLKPSIIGERDPSIHHKLYGWFDGKFSPIKESAAIAEIITASPWPGLPTASYRMIGVWDKVFMNAEIVMEAAARGEAPKQREKEVFQQILRLIISRDERMFNLASQYFTLSDVINIWKRMIGTGMIGGKSVGMLLARAILRKNSPKWGNILEEHDSFYIASDVFYTFLVKNNCWWARQRQKDPKTFLDGNEAVRKRILKGKFPEYIVTRFADMLEYFGHSPIIVRSSSLLEDNFGNTFAGKYESVFCANQGSKEERLKNFIDAVRFIYASTMSDEALAYRKNRGVLDKDEQMALLVQRVSGISHGTIFFPHLAGVGFSINPYAWNKEIDPEAGMLRLVFGLGTRAVNRFDDDYTRVVALNAPEKRPEANFDEVKRYAQRRVDVLDLSSNQFTNIYFADIVKSNDGGLKLNLFATKDKILDEYLRQQHKSDGCPWVLTFDNLFKKTEFVGHMREMLKILREAYECHVDIEFTTNFFPDGTYKINLVQCRPLQFQKSKTSLIPKPEIEKENLIMLARGAVIGHSRTIPIDRIIYVVPAVYGKLSESKRYTVARLIGNLIQNNGSKPQSIILIGPGRWGTSTPSLGI